HKGFRAVNCATFTSEMLASELFGHVKGAFTGAVRERKGLFALADGGTLFLDEVAEIPLELQSRLLRVLQEQSFVPLGGSVPVKVNVRFISATHRALRREVEENRFREDLLYRLRVVPVFLPPLRDRVGDVEGLVHAFVIRFNEAMERQVESISDDALESLLLYRWPGNIRELRNVIEYAFAVGEGPEISLDELPPELRGEAPPEDDLGRKLTIKESERESIVAALSRTHGHKAQAASLLGMSRSTLWRKLREYQLLV
ncbi:MAG TPA: sigma-54-dependent Fis family transcriptional regulator, partial [Myxococcales bacterium]|nr:sigma-54-dependent Fis family transcriptional regulator [Myxococcales bacterium]